MKKLLYIIPLLFGMALTSCYDEEIEKINGRLDDIENTQIATVNQQITSINNSILLLNNTDKELGEYITALESKAENLQSQITTTNTKIDDVKAEILATVSSENANILAELEAFKATVNGELEAIKAVLETLRAKDAELEGKIEALQEYVDGELESAEDWATATFATLEQYNSLATELATIKALVEQLETDVAADLPAAISALETSMKGWVNEQLAGYYTIAQIDAKISLLEATISEGDEALQNEVDALKESLAEQKTELTAAYQNAIAEAITANNGVIDEKIATEITTVNAKIAGLEERVDDLESRVTALEENFDNQQEQITSLINRIQSITYIPTFDDGKATIDYYSKRGTLDFQISPKSAVAELEKVWQSALSFKAVHTQTRAVDFINLPIVAFEADATDGVISIEVDGTNLGDNFFIEKITASATLEVSDGNNCINSPYTNLTANYIIRFEDKEVERICILNWDTDGDLKLSYDEAATVECLQSVFNGKDIIVFDELEFFIGLTQIDGFNGCNHLAHITLPHNVTSIGTLAFNNCSNMKNFLIPQFITSIGSQAFANCKGTITISSGIIEVDYSGSDYPNRASSGWLYNSLFESIIIGNNITKIGNYAFYHCSSRLKRIYVPNGVTSIGEYAFSSCVGLSDVIIPSSVISIGNAAFSGCDNLTSIIIPKSVVKIGYNAFLWCENLVGVFCQATTPPAGNSNMFSSNHPNRKIYVPTESVEAYKSAEYWSEYADDIVGYDFE